MTVSLFWGASFHFSVDAEGMAVGSRAASTGDSWLCLRVFLRGCIHQGRTGVTASGFLLLDPGVLLVYPRTRFQVLQIIIFQILNAGVFPAS